MRAVFDFCNKYGLHSVAQGMIELPPPRLLRELVAEEALRDSHLIHQYGARVGAAPYLDAVVAFLKRRHGVVVPREAVLATAGVSGAIVSTLLMLRQQGRRRIALLEPFYTYHRKQVEAVYGFEPLCVRCDAAAGFAPDWTTIEATFAGPGLDCVILTNPNNPSGRCWRRDEMLRLVRLCEQHNALLILDEIYCDMVWHGEHFSPLLEPLSRAVVVCRGSASRWRRSRGAWASPSRIRACSR